MISEGESLQGQERYNIGKLKQRKKKVGIEACFEWQYPLLSGKILKRSSPREL